MGIFPGTTLREAARPLLASFGGVSEPGVDLACQRPGQQVCSSGGVVVLAGGFRGTFVGLLSL